MLFFDLDGTLIDSSGVWLKIDLDFTSQRGLAHTREYHDVVAHMTAPTAAQFTKEYYGLSESAEEIMAQWQAQALCEYRDNIEAKPYAREFLTQCKESGERMALLTSVDPVLCRAVLKRNRFEEFFERLIFAQELGIEKGDPRLFRTAAELMGVDIEECVLFDDSPVACRSAKEAGMRVVAVRDPIFDDAKTELRAHCDRYIDDFSALLKA